MRFTNYLNVHVVKSFHTWHIKSTFYRCARKATKSLFWVLDLINLYIRNQGSIPQKFQSTRELFNMFQKIYLPLSLALSHSVLVYTRHTELFFSSSLISFPKISSISRGLGSLEAFSGQYLSKARQMGTRFHRCRYSEQQKLTFGKCSVDYMKYTVSPVR